MIPQNDQNDLLAAIQASQYIGYAKGQYYDPYVSKIDNVKQEHQRKIDARKAEAEKKKDEDDDYLFVPAFVPDAVEQVSERVKNNISKYRSKCMFPRKLLTCIMFVGAIILTIVYCNQMREIAPIEYIFLPGLIPCNIILLSLGFVSRLSSKESNSIPLPTQNTGLNSELKRIADVDSFEDKYEIKSNSVLYTFVFLEIGAHALIGILNFSRVFGYYFRSLSANGATFLYLLLPIIAAVAYFFFSIKLSGKYERFDGKTMAKIYSKADEQYLRDELAKDKAELKKVNDRIKILDDETAKDIKAISAEMKAAVDELENNISPEVVMYLNCVNYRDNYVNTHFKGDALETVLDGDVGENLWLVYLKAMEPDTTSLKEAILMFESDMLDKTIAQKNQIRERMKGVYLRSEQNYRYENMVEQRELREKLSSATIRSEREHEQKTRIYEEKRQELDEHIEAREALEKALEGR